MEWQYVHCSGSPNLQHKGGKIRLCIVFYSRTIVVVDLLAGVCGCFCGRMEDDDYQGRNIKLKFVVGNVRVFVVGQNIVWSN